MTRPGRVADRLALMLAATALVTVALSVYVFCTVLVAPANPLSASGSAEGYVWTVARYQLAYARFERQLLLYTTGRDTRLDELAHQHDNLQDSFAILTRPGATATHVERVPQYEDAVRQLHVMMARLDTGMAHVSDDPYAADDMLRTVQQYWFPMHGLLNAVRLLEMQQRDRAFQDYLHEREMLLRGGVIVVLLCGAALVHLMLLLRRRGRIIERQRTALLAERQATVQARATIQARNTLLAMVSHEIRLPLHAIDTAVGLLFGRERSQLDELAITRIQRAAQDLLQLVDDLTDYALLEAGKLELRPVAFDIGALLRELVDDARRLAGNKPVTVGCSIETDAVRLVSDPRRVRQIVANLLANAIRHTDAGSVTVTLRRDATAPTDHPALQIAVSDTGPGIAQADHGKLFEPFTRLDPRSARVHAGLGLGLSIVRTVTQALGGQVAVTSEPGRGTTFRLTLPLQQPPA